MKIVPSMVRAFCLALICIIATSALAAEGYDDSIQAFLHEIFDYKNCGMVVGIVDEHGVKTFSAGKLDNGTDDDVNADTVFEIGSVTKTFTALLLFDAVERGEVQLDDPVAKYLPDTVKMPTHGGKEITLANLAAQDSGLPFNADNLTGNDWAERFRTYTVEKMYAFLSGYTLTQDPGAKFQYSNLGMGLLGHVLGRKADRHFESLIVERICQPLKMDSTCITLSPELKSRFATGHDEAGKPAANFELPAIGGAGAIRSTVNDMLKFVAANLGLTPSPLVASMQKTHEIRHRNATVRDTFPGRSAFPWFDEGVFTPPDSDFLGHAGGTGGYNSFVGLDLKQRRGVVVLTNQLSIHSSMLGWRILQHARLNGLDPANMQPLREMNGAGVVLGIDTNSGSLIITRVLANSPAQKAGLLAGQIIKSIDGTPTANINLADCVALIRGPAGSQLKLELADVGQDHATAVELTRQKFLLDE